MWQGSYHSPPLCLSPSVSLCISRGKSQTVGRVFSRIWHWEAKAKRQRVGRKAPIHVPIILYS